MSIYADVWARLDAFGEIHIPLDTKEELCGGLVTNIQSTLKIVTYDVLKGAMESILESTDSDFHKFMADKIETTSSEYKITVFNLHHCYKCWCAEYEVPRFKSMEITNRLIGFDVEKVIIGDTYYYVGAKFCAD